MERSEKRKVSNILLEKREWFDANEKKPPIGERVVIRFTNDNIIYGETETEVYYAEDIKVGRYLQSIEAVNGESGRWVIDPPYPKYDYSPLSKKENLLEGSYVTHWAYPEDGELEGWDTRFDMHNKYEKLRIEVDPDQEEDVYRAFMWGASFLSRTKEFHECPDGKGIRKLYGILCDLQYCIDKNIYIDNGEEIHFDNDLQEALDTINKATEVLKEYSESKFEDCMNPPIEDDSKLESQESNNEDQIEE